MEVSSQFPQHLDLNRTIGLIKLLSDHLINKNVHKRKKKAFFIALC